jgi:hypothetical protein
VLTQTVEAARDHRATLVSKDEASAQMTIGSDSVFRVWGLLTPKLSCPMRFEVSVTPKAGNQTVVSVEVENAPGWYAFELKRLSEWKVHQAFRGLLAMLRGSSGGVEVALDESVDLSLPTILDQITMFLGSAGETGPADTIRGLRERVDRGERPRSATASSEGVLGRLVVESLNGKGITGREFSEANRAYLIKFAESSKNRTPLRFPGGECWPCVIGCNRRVVLSLRLVEQRSSLAPNASRPTAWCRPWRWSIIQAVPSQNVWRSSDSCPRGGPAISTPGAGIVGRVRLCDRPFGEVIDST